MRLSNPYVGTDPKYGCDNDSAREDDKENQKRKREKVVDKWKEVTGKWKKYIKNKNNKPSSQHSEPTLSDREEVGKQELLEKMQHRPSICLQPLKECADLGLSFSGCGFLGLYHCGVVKCFLRNGGPLLSRLRRVSGASAGSLVAALFLLAHEDIDRGVQSFYDLADELNALKFGALSPGFYLADRLVNIVDSILPDDVTPANDKLFISLTNHKTRQNRLVSAFPDREYLIKCLNASCYIPMYSMGLRAPPPEIDGESYIDGGYSNNLPDYADMRTITISPFCSKCDISPADPSRSGADWNMTLGNQILKVNLRNIVRGAQALFPPQKESLKHFYEQGYKDAFRFLFDNDLLQRPVGSSV